MRVFRGGEPTELTETGVTTTGIDEPAVETDQKIRRAFVDRTAETGETGLRVWQPPRKVAFGRRDANRPGYEGAQEHAARRGYTPVERSVGGHAVAFTGTTVAFALAEPVEDARLGINERYERTTSLVASALTELGVETEQGEPEGAFCPGTHSLSGTGKIAGLAQRVRTEVAVVSGVVVVRDHEAIADVLEPVYGELDVPFERDAVGSIARASGEATPAVVMDTLVEHLSQWE